MLLALVLAQTLTVQVDALADRHPIDPRIYGVNFASTEQLQDLGAKLNRSGGNATTRYNWEQNASNHASDWYFETLEHGPEVPSQEVDSFVDETKAGGAEPMITVPIIGWVARLGPNRRRTCSFSVAKYGLQQDTDWQWFPDAGNGRRPNGSEITGNDPHDANMPVDSSFQRPWIEHLVSTRGVRYFVLDNEHTLWSFTHRDVRPAGATMDEIRQRMIDYAAMIKSVDPTATVAGPEEWGWLGYLLSGYDQQWAEENRNWSNTPDRIAHGGADYLPWLLSELHQRHIESGQRLLDVFTVHFYPQGGEFSDDVSPAMQLRRNRSTRALWDPAYRDETWINDRVRLIPRLHEWVDTHYPGTAIGLTEYSWGADHHMNGATAQADVLGILGREGVDLAARWVTPETGSPAYNAIKLYRGFGDISVRATVPDPDNVAAFAAVRSRDGALTLMLINKQLTTPAAMAIALANFASRGKVERWQLTGAGIQRLPDAESLTITLPAQSVTLLVVPHARKRRALR
jgi:hypothetical protein